MKSITTEIQKHNNVTSLGTPAEAQQLPTGPHSNWLPGVCMRINAPPPEGFGVKVHLTSLRRFRSHWKSLHHIMKNEEILDRLHDRRGNSKDALLRPGVLECEPGSVHLLFWLPSWRRFGSAPPKFPHLTWNIASFCRSKACALVSSDHT